ncbi:sulfite reductase flavoprotein subunit alpha [Niveispirillum irakense]|uniref:sulfite reductase flavoprotein subunit alpha n=1 Tax=Niveispirillum irakense TaxID=34011 RepID=UPI00040E8350|nr:sulfite reductase flavoprotein subunit alpha [Niveispirillum irakense]
MARNILFQLHWFLGITAGLVLAVMGVTGAMMTFEDEILAALNPRIMQADPRRGPVLDAPGLIAGFERDFPGARVVRLIVHDDPSRTAWISFVPPGERERRSSYVDPVTGTLLGEAQGEAFFAFITRLHRWLALPDGGNGIGRQITGFSAIALIYFALSGLYLRWPRHPLDWRAWLVLDLRKTGRNLYRALHAVIGGWVLVFYLLSGLTGLWWSYDWYREGVRYALTGEKSTPAPAVGAGGSGGSRARAETLPPDLTQVWQSFRQATADRRYETVTLIVRGADNIQFRAMLPGARHDRVSDELTIDGRTGAVVSHVPYAQRTVGQDIITSIYELHRGAYFGLAGRIGIMLASLTMPLFTITGFLLYFARRRRRKGAMSVAEPALSPSGIDGAGTLIVYASQTGTAERIARLTAQAMPGAALLPLSRLDEPALAQAQCLLLIASTYGEGEPPDAARGFVRRFLGTTPALSHLRYAVLALGDREYPDFCAFGHQLDHFLHAAGAERLFDLIEMDGEDADAQRQWQQQLTGLGARTDQPDWAPAPMAEWRLVERRLLNPGSAGEATFHIALEPVGGRAENWLPGDILEIAPRQDPARLSAYLVSRGLPDTAENRDLLASRILPAEVSADIDVTSLPPLPHREYSVASIPSSGRVELIVRQCRAADGFLGLGSGWLTALAPIGGVVQARIRANAGFHPPAASDAPLILIGNGTGLAGLLAHLRYRAAEGGGPVWLFWGERHPDHDHYHAEELLSLQVKGVLAGGEYAWSRLPGDQRAYVQDKVTVSATIIADLVNKGAAIFVCGSVQGMAPAVHHALSAILGEEMLETMVEHGRYRRDIY